ncbi:MAG: bis(5'-nucleosyl)-tetraphosphatase (symmetrical) YqeK [Catonella sp.]|jgi:predicted HD superfamily hydrolase involved in NAD metabolism|nr:bis(5'-nucleosyl)-tetraphosphatase (symmetrical) YqeK [Catonella sp.]MDY6357598.1 bis(5'-nucleosyl)-tetraphosphatase (symmetrical) YqeK [Catonella sp.]
METEEIESRLREVLNPHRFEHTLGVSFTSASLAMRYEYDIKKARLAGLLHDCAKYMKGDELLLSAERYNLPVSKYERANPGLLHAKVGAYLAEHTYGVDDEEILSAIRFHTTGRPGMSLLEEIVFVADFIEPGRKELKCLPGIRKDAFIDIHRATLGELENTINYLKDKDANTDPATLETRDYYKKLILSE